MREWLLLGGGGLVAFVVALWVTPWLRKVALRRYWIDHLDEDRKLHSDPIPRVGGIGLAAGLALATLYFWAVSPFLPRLDFAGDLLYPVIAGGALFGAGLYDDLHGLGFKRKFVVQVVVAYVVLCGGYRFDVSGVFLWDASPFEEALLSIPLTMLWIVGMINAVNLIDGLDGLAGGVTIIGLVALTAAFGFAGAKSVLAVAAIGGVAGFLVHNRHPASIFMGDSGSMMLGFLVAVYAMEGTGHVDPLLALVVPVVAVGLPVADTLLSFARRLVAGRSPFSPDADHIHHRALRRFKSVPAAVGALYGGAACLGALAVLLSHLAALPAWGVLAGGGAVFALALRSLGYLNVRATLRRLHARFERRLDRHRQINRERREAAAELIKAHREPRLDPTPSQAE